MRAGGFAASCVTLLSLSASADDRPRVNITIDRCDTIIAEDVGRIAAIELHATRVEQAADVTRIHAICETPDEIALEVVDPLTSKGVTRKVSIAHVDPRARARTIALAVAELVSASWVELETTPEPKVQPIPRRVPRRAPAHLPPKSEAPPVVFQAALSAQVFFESRELLLGGGLVVEPWLARSVLLHFVASVAHASTTRAPGSVNVDVASSAAAIGVGSNAGALRLTATVGLRAGYAHLVGFATARDLRGQAIDGAWVGPEIGLGLELFPRAHVHAVIRATMGWAVAGIDAPVPGDRDVLARGPYGALAFGFAAN